MRLRGYLETYTLTQAGQCRSTTPAAVLRALVGNSFLGCALTALLKEYCRLEKHFNVSTALSVAVNQEIPFPPVEDYRLLHTFIAITR